MRPQYWFARYRLVPTRSKGLVPLNWKGRAVISGFISAMVIGGMLFLIFGILGQMVLGVLIFAGMAVAGAGVFLWAATQKCDPVKTIATYRAPRLG